MKARSLVFDLFGDYLRYRGGEVRLRGLVKLMGAFASGSPTSAPTVTGVTSRFRARG